MSSYEVVVTDTTDPHAETCFTATITPAPWTARSAQELAEDLSRCLTPGHLVVAVRAVGGRDEGRAES